MSTLQKFDQRSLMSPHQVYTYLKATFSKAFLLRFQALLSPLQLQEHEEVLPLMLNDIQRSPEARRVMLVAVDRLLGLQAISART